jgi:GNAT superfamily N-acetyltransferase
MEPQKTVPFAIRPLSPERDLNSWLELFNAIESVDGSDGPTTESQLRETLQRPDHLRWVIDDPTRPGALAAYGLLAKLTAGECGLNIVVSPNWRSKGMGTGLAQYLLQQARGCDGKYASAYIEGENKTSHDFLINLGFQVDGHYWLMEAPAGLPVETPRWPEGFYSLSFAEVGYFSILLDAMHRSYKGHWSHMENIPGLVTEDSVAGWMEQYLWDPRGMFIAFGPDGRPAGYTRIQLTRRDQPEDQSPDVIDNPGVAPEFVSLGLQRQLVQESLQWRKDFGDRAVRIESWGDSQETINLYNEMGFRPLVHGTSYRFDLD